MFLRKFLFLAALLVLAFTTSPAFADLPQVSGGLSYLTLSQGPDGNWAAASSLVESTAATATALESLRQLNQTGGVTYGSGASWLQSQSPQTVAYIAERIVALNLTDGSADTLIPALDTLKGAWGGYDGYETDVLDTALALQALKNANLSSSTTLSTALAFLTSCQNPDGGWGFCAGAESNVYMTSVVAATLERFPQVTSIASAVGRASGYLLAHQNPDGGFGGAGSSVYETALAYVALAGNGQTQGLPLQDAVNFLTANQSVNGSWNDDPYSTALAIKALYLSENRPSPPPPPPAGGTISGTVIDAVTTARVAGAAVVLGGNSLVNTTTDSSGNFTLSDVPAGSQTVNFSLAGYAAKSVSAGVTVGSVTALGNVPLTSSHSTGNVAGTITDNAGKPLADVTVTVTGAWSGSAVTATDGTYSFSYVTPGEVTVSAAKGGFQTATGNATVFARTTLSFSPRLTASIPQTTTGTLVGRVVEDYWGVPIGHLPEEEGVTVKIAGRTVYPGDDGYFSVEGLAPNTYQVVVGMNGFASKTFRAVISAGVTTDLGTVRLAMSVSEMTLTGKVTDAATGAPIPGAEVTIPDIDLAGRADFAGTYAIADIDQAGEFTLKASATGYNGRTFLVRFTPWTHTIDIALTPHVTTGSLTGVVVDAATNEPVQGATLTVLGDEPVSAATDGAGSFTFPSVPQGAQRVTVAGAGYSQRTLTTAITAGAVNDAGTVALSVTPLPASVRGKVWDAAVNAPFAGVTMQAKADESTLTAGTDADGRYLIDNVAPGTVTVATGAVPKQGYGSARFTAILEPGGLLVFNPTLSTTMPAVLDLTVASDKAVYKPGETVAFAIKATNRLSVDTAAVLHLQVTDPAGATVFERSEDLAFAADGAADIPMSFALPAGTQSGAYRVTARVYGVNGQMVRDAAAGFGVAVSQVAVTPVLPAAFSMGGNTVSFHLANNGTLAVSDGMLAVSLKDPEGAVVSENAQRFSLDPGQGLTLNLPVSVPSLKFGTYTLSYTQSDETKGGAAAEIALPNSVAVAALYDQASHRVRNTAGLTVTVTNTGRFNLEPAGAAGTGATVTVSVPDAAYAQAKTLAPVPGPGNAAGTVLAYSFAIPETLSAGQHGTRIAVALPSGSALVQTAPLSIMDSSLSLSPVMGAYSLGDVIRPVFANDGGVDTQVSYGIKLYDAKSTLIAETAATETVAAGATLTAALAIPAGAVDGSYNLVIGYKDLKTGKEVTSPNPIAINGVKASLAVSTDKQNYLLSEGIAGLSSVASVTPLTGNLHLQVTPGAGAEQVKTWTSRADFQSGVRSGVDTYGVNDWMIPDDDFDASTLDTGKWSPGGNVSIQSGKLFLDTTQAAATSSVTSKWSLEGDFDVQVDFSSNNSTDGGGAQLSVLWGSDSALTIGNRAASGYASQAVVHGVQQTDLHAGYYAGSGRFRIARTAGTAIAYYWGGSTWIELNRSTASVMADPCSVALGRYRAEGVAGGTAAFDNLKVAGRVGTENQTVDSVRLLPLNDNFDDGILNEDRWQVSGPKPVESAGAARLTSTAAAIQNVLAYRYLLPGDFTAVSAYNNFAAAPAKSAEGSYIMSANVGSSGIYMHRISFDSYRAGGDFIVSLSSVNSSFLMSSELPYTSASGQFRLRRQGSTAYNDYWDGTRWINQHARSSFPSGPAQLYLYSRTEEKVPTVNVSVDSFSTSKGTYAAGGTIKLRYDSGTGSTQWSKLTYTAASPAETSVKFRTRTSETEAGLDTALWSGYLTSSGAAITSLPGRWIEVESSLSTANAGVTPVLDDIAVSYAAPADRILWQADVPVDQAAGAVSELNSAIGALGVTGKLYLEGTLTSGTGQTVASTQYPFFVEQGNVQLLFAPDRKIYRAGETVTVTGRVQNLSSVAAAGLTVRVERAGNQAASLLAETFDLPAGAVRDFGFTTTAGADGAYLLKGTVTQNAATLSENSELYEVASPALTAAMAAPESAGSAPFTVSVSLANSGKVPATARVKLTDDGGTVAGDEEVTVGAGETRVLQYSRQIVAATAYTAAVTGDLNQVLSKRVEVTVEAAAASVSAKISADRISYNANDRVTLASTVSANSTIENLTTLLTVTDTDGQAVYSATSAIPVVFQGQAVANKNYWNTGNYPPGTYLVTLQVQNGQGVGVFRTTCSFAISQTVKPAALLKGNVSLDRQSILTGQPVAVSYTVTNTGNVDLADISLAVRTMTVDGEAAAVPLNGQAALAMGSSYTATGTIDTGGLAAKDYLVVLTASIAGVEETLDGSYFRVEGAPSAPALSAPGNGTDVETPTPTLSVSNAADPNDDKLTYRFEVYADAGLTELVDSGTVSETAGSTSWTVNAPLAENGSYHWRARSYDGMLYGPWMEHASFRVNVADDAPTAPVVSSPMNGSSVATSTPRLVVGNAGDPDSAGLTYNFQIALDPAFTQVVAAQSGVAAGEASTAWTVTESLQENATYYWRAQADDWLVEGPWSETATFFVNTTNEPPTTPTVIAPAAGSTVTALSADAVAANSSDPDSPALSYFFEADTAPTFDSGRTIRSGSVAPGQDTTSWRLGGLEDNTPYYLRVKASDGSAESPWSEATRFFVNTANDPPTTPTLANPSSGGAVDLFDPVLSVHNASDLDRDTLSYEFELYADQGMETLVARAGGIVESAGITGWQVPVRLEENRTYTWRTRAFDGSLYSQWMAPATFMVNTANDAPAAPRPVAPAEGSSVDTLVPTLAVQNAADADGDGLTYDFEIHSGGSPVASTTGVPEDASGVTSWTTATALRDENAYQWRARAYDGDSYGPWTPMSSFTVHIPQTSVNATVNFDPNTLNRSSNGTWVTVYIELPSGYRPADIDVASVRLEGTVPAESKPYSVSDRDKDGIADLMVKFRRSAVASVLGTGDRVPVHVTGRVGGVSFEGVDLIRVTE